MIGFSVISNGELIVSKKSIFTLDLKVIEMSQILPDKEVNSTEREQKRQMSFVRQMSEKKGQ